MSWSEISIDGSSRSVCGSLSVGATRMWWTLKRYPTTHEDEIVLVAEQPQEEARIVQQSPELDADHQPAAADVDDDVGVRRHQAAAGRPGVGPPSGGTRRAPPASSSSSAFSDTPLE